MHHQQMENVSHRAKSYQWLDKALLTDSTEADCSVQSTLTHCNVKDPFIYSTLALHTLEVLKLVNCYLFFMLI